MTINQNSFLRSTGFNLSLRSDKYPGLDCQIQSIAHPALTVGAAQHPTPRRIIPVPGDQYNYDPLSFTMIIEQDMASYITVFNWMQDIIENTDETAYRDKISDITLSIFNTKNNLTKRITYVNAFPTDLGALNFAITDTSDEYITCDVILNYVYFKIS